MSETKRSKAVKPLPYRIEYNTDLYPALDAEDLKRQYIISIKADDESTIVYTDNGYFELEKDQAEFIVEACNNYERVCAERDQAVESLEVLHPVWAEGWNDGSVSNQVACSALGQIWKLIGVTNQTDCMQKLTSLCAEKEELVKVLCELLAVMPGRGNMTAVINARALLGEKK